MLQANMETGSKIGGISHFAKTPELKSKISERKMNANEY